MILSPLSKISPSVGISKPAIILNVVDLPQPDGPKNVTNSPLLTSRLKLSTTVVLPNDFFTPLSEIMTSFPIITPFLT